MQGHKKAVILWLPFGMFFLFVYAFLLVSFWPQPDTSPPLDPQNPDYTNAPTASDSKSNIEKLQAVAKNITGQKEENPSDKVENSSIVTFDSASSKQTFLANNNLQESDLEQIGNRQSYEVSTNQEKLNLPSGTKAQDNIQYFASATPNDPLHGSQYYPTLINLDDAWDTTTGDSGTVVAVIDNGFALSHEDMENRWYLNTAENGAGKDTNGVDDDGNGKIDDWRGWDFANGTEDNSPQAGTTNPTNFFVSHGTNTSGLIGATGNNSKGVASANWSAQIMPLQALRDTGSGTSTDVIAAIDYAVEQNADIISMSLGSNDSDPLMESALDDAITTGITVIAAAGNCGGTNYADQGCDYRGQMSYPARYDNVIAVGATDSDDERASFSSWGEEMDISAPGTGTIRTPTWSQSNGTTGYTTSASGTSISTPIISGVASLIKAENPAYTPAEVKTALENHASKTSQMNCQLQTQEIGRGRVDADASVTDDSVDLVYDDCKSALGSADFNGNGNDDIFWYGPGADSDLLWSGSKTKGNFAETSVNINGDYTPISGDFNGDGNSDIFWYGPGSGSDVIWFGTGTKGSFTSTSKSVSGNYTPVSGDFNGDGEGDILWYAPGSASDRIWYGTTTKGSFKSYSATINGTYIPLAGDFNDNTKDDIFWYGVGANSDRIWYGSVTKGKFVSVSENVTGTYDPVSGDFNGDGNSDIAWYGVGTDPDRLWYGRNTKGSWTSKAMTQSGTYTPIY